MTKSSKSKALVAAATVGAAMATGTAGAAVELNKEVIQSAPAADTGTPAVAIVAATSKASVANAIFKEMFGLETVPARKDMIQRVMKEANLTEKGAATYLQNYKAKNGLTKPKAVAATA